MLAAFLTRTRLTLKQHRFETIAIALVAVVLVAGAAITAYRLNAITFPKGCDQMFAVVGPNGPESSLSQADMVLCQQAQTRFDAIYTEPEVGILRVLMALTPLLAGLALGAPLVARDIEQGTAPLSWALAGSRIRWLLPKFLATSLFLVVVLAAVAVASDVLFGALKRIDPNATFQEHQFRGAMVIGVGLFTFATAVALGTVLRRTLPAIVLALVGCVVALVFGQAVVQGTLLQPLVVAAWKPTDANAMQWQDMSNDLYIGWSYYLNGVKYTGDPQQWWAEHTPQPIIVGPDGQPLDENGKPITDPAAFKPQEQLDTIPDVIKASNYWTVVAIETGLMLGAAVLASGLAFFVINRRRPY